VNTDCDGVVGMMRSLRNALVPRAGSVAVKAGKAAQGRRPFFASKNPFSDALSVHRDTPNNNADTVWDFTPENYAQIDDVLSKYPPNYKRSGVMPLLLWRRSSVSTCLSTATRAGCRWRR